MYSGERGRLKNANDSPVPGGTRFILLFGAEDVSAFTKPMPGEARDSLRVRVGRGAQSGPR